jgi:hypothetical protein
VYPGDIVILDNAGLVAPASAGTTPVIGVAASYAASGAECLVWDDPNQMFMIQSDDATDPDAQTDVGLNYNLVATAGSSLYKASRMELDGNTGATDSNLPLRLLAVERTVDNALGGYADCVVILNNHRLKLGTVGL